MPDLRTSQPWIHRLVDGQYRVGRERTMVGLVDTTGVGLPRTRSLWEGHVRMNGPPLSPWLSPWPWSDADEASGRSSRHHGAACDMMCRDAFGSCWTDWGMGGEGFCGCRVPREGKGKCDWREFKAMNRSSRAKEAKRGGLFHPHPNPPSLPFPSLPSPPHHPAHPIQFIPSYPIPLYARH